MDAGRMIRGAWEAVPILFLLLVGGLIAIRSGVKHPPSRNDLKQLVNNVSQIVFRVLAYGAALLVVHEWIGMRAGLGW